VAKNRNGPDGIIYPIYMDTSRVKIKIFASQNETIEGIAAVSAKEQKQSLKERYKKFKEQT
jgi:hypothetical protein